jgi:hypothetical protein
MTKLKVNGLEELAALLPQGAELSKNAQCNIKGGCSSCEDTRRPPRRNGRDRDRDRDND